MTKISDLSAIAGASIDTANDLVTVVDASAVGAARNKKMIFDELRIGLGLGVAASPQFTAVNIGHASDTTLTRTGAGDIAVEGNALYRAGGTDVPLADGGTGASLADPNADRILFWDDSAGQVTWLQLGTNLSITGTTIDASGGGGAITVKDEGSNLTTSLTSLDFVGAGVVATNTGGAVTVTISGAGGSGGVQSVPVLASAMTPRTTNGPSVDLSELATNKVMVYSLEFDQSTAEYAQFIFPMPKSWNESTITAQFLWMAGTTGNVVWGIQAVGISDDDPMDAAFGTAQTVTDAVTAANDLMQSAFTAAVTVGGSPAEGDMVVFQVYRDASNGSDTLAADAKLISIRLNFTTNAADDS